MYSHRHGANSYRKSSNEITMSQEKEVAEKRRQANHNTGGDPGSMKEHDRVPSGLGKLGKHASTEISMGPQDSGNVPANPFASLAQEGYLHAHPEKLGATKLAEFDKETKGKKLPYKVKGTK